MNSISDEDKLKIKGTKDVEDCWAFQLKDHYEDKFKKLNELVQSIQLKDNDIYNRENYDKEAMTFVVVL